MIRACWEIGLRVDGEFGINENPREIDMDNWGKGLYRVADSEEVQEEVITDLNIRPNKYIL